MRLCVSADAYDPAIDCHETIKLSNYSLVKTDTKFTLSGDEIASPAVTLTAVVPLSLPSQPLPPRPETQRLKESLTRSSHKKGPAKLAAKKEDGREKKKRNFAASRA